MSIYFIILRKEERNEEEEEQNNRGTAKEKANFWMLEVDLRVLWIINLGTLPNLDNTKEVTRRKPYPQGASNVTGSI